MNPLHGVTVRQVLSALRQYRPFVALAAIIALLLIAVPADDDGDNATSTLAGGPLGSLPADAGGVISGDAATAPGQAGQISGGASTRRQGPGGASSGPGTASASGTAWPGLGTQAALSAPDCDAATGRLKLPTKIFALPCVPLWPKGADNGGTTARGVTADAVKIVVYHPQVDAATQAALVAAGVSDTDEQLMSSLAGITKLFGRHAELYGRKLQLIHVEASGTELENQRADAIDAFNRHQPFAAVTLSAACGPGGFAYQMALRKVQGLCSTTDLLANLRQAGPYYWITPYAGVLLQEQHLLLTAELICKRLKGRPAKWAGDPLYRTQQRKFGYLYIDAPENAPAKDLFTHELAACGVALDAVGISADLAQGQEQIPTAIARFHDNDDTVVVIDAGFINSGVASKQATNQNYRPEWLATGFGYTDATIFVRATWDPTQATALYALREVMLQPAKENGDGWSLYRWENGQNPPAKLLGQDSQLPVWHAIASAIQLAGPTLTGETFAAGLLRLPPNGGSYTGGVASVAKAFGNHGIWPWESNAFIDTTAVDDTTFTWWSATAQGQDEAGNQGPGMMMFVDGGKRYRLGSLPSTEPDFFGGNGTAQISELGPADKPPSYPNKQGCATRQDCYG